MSAAAVRTALRSALDTLLVPDGFAFVESINQAESTKVLPNKWYTLDFPPAQVDPISLGVPQLFREQGSCGVSIWTPQQTQDTDAVNAAEIVRQQMTHWTDPTGMIRVRRAQPPSEMDGGDFRGSFYGVSVDLDYAYDFYI